MGGKQGVGSVFIQRKYEKLTKNIDIDRKYYVKHVTVFVLSYAVILDGVYKDTG